MHENERLNDHQKFKELAALAQGRGLTVSERIDLKRHLQLCEACREIYREYSLLSSEGMAFLAADCGHVSEADAWDYRAAQNELFSRIRESEYSAITSAEVASTEVDRPSAAHVFGAWIARVRWAAAAAVACLLVGVGAYHLGSRRPAELASLAAVTKLLCWAPGIWPQLPLPAPTRALRVPAASSRRASVCNISLYGCYPKSPIRS